MKSLIRSGVALVAAAALGAGMVLGGAALSNGKGNGNGNGLGGQPATASQIYLDEIKDYGVCRGTDPTCYHEWGNGWTEGEPKRILIWSRTAGPRHAHLGTPLAPGPQPAPERQQRRPGGAHRMGGGARHRRRLHRGPRAVPPEQLPGGRVPQLQPRHAGRHGADDADAVHPRRRRVRRHPQRVRRRVPLAVLRGPAGRSELLQPRPEPRRHGRDDQQQRRVDVVHAGDLGVQGRVVQPDRRTRASSTSCSRSTRPRARRRSPATASRTR